MRRTTAALTTILTPAAFIPLSAAPADATYRNYVCEAGEFCVYGSITWSGQWKDVPNAVSNWRDGDAPIASKDSSWRNKFGGPIRVYKGSSYTGGAALCVNAGIARTAGRLSNFDDRGGSNHNMAAC